MKKLLSMIAALALVLTLAGCGKKEEQPVEKETYELALVTGISTVKDKGFNQDAWKGISLYAKENNLTSKIYDSEGQTNEAYSKAIEDAINGGAKVVVTPGLVFNNAVFDAQNKYPDVKFILIDGTPHNTNETVYEVKDNTVAITYAEQEAGFLAGYALVKDGQKDLGFIGGMTIPAVQKFGIGYLQGIDYAAKELGVEGVNVKYNYAGTFTPSDVEKNKALAWYNDGVETIFAAAGGIAISVMDAASEAGKKVVGIDVDQYDLSDTVVISAVKNLNMKVYDLIKEMYEGEFPGGENFVYDLSNGGVSLSMEHNKLTGFSNDDYDALVKKIVDGEIKINGDVANSLSREGLNSYVKNITIDFIE